MEQLAKEGSALAGRWIWYDSAFSRDDDLLDEARGEHRDRISQDADRTSQDGDRVSDENPPTGDDAMSSHSSPGSSGTGSSEASEASSEPSSEPSSDPLDAEAAVVVKVPTQQPSGIDGAARKGGQQGGQQGELNESCVLRRGGEADGLASMRTAATAVRTTGAAGLCARKRSGEQRGGEQDGLASMRTAATAVRTTGAAAGSCALRRTATGEDDGLASMRTAATAVRTTGESRERRSGLVSSKGSLGRYWLPWHIDSQFITLLTCDDFFDEASLAPLPPSSPHVTPHMSHPTCHTPPVTPHMSHPILPTHHRHSPLTHSAHGRSRVGAYEPRHVRPRRDE